MENRIENNLRTIARTLLVDLPQDKSFTLDEFVSKQREHIRRQADELESKNLEMERAVRDILDLARSYRVESGVPLLSDAECACLVEHYDHFLYTALLHCVKSSLNTLKQRVSSRSNGVGERAIFDLEVQLIGASVSLSPMLNDMQFAINRTAVAVLECMRSLRDWGNTPLSELGVRDLERVEEAAGDGVVVQPGSAGSAGRAPSAAPATFFPRIARSMEIVRVVLLLTGSIQGARDDVASFLDTFNGFRQLWQSEPDAAYREFIKCSPTIADYEHELSKFAAVEEALGCIAATKTIGALCLHTANIKAHLKQCNAQFKSAYSDNLHRQAQNSLVSLTDYFKSTLGKLNRAPDALDSIKFLMDVMKEIRETEAMIDLQINPILDMYSLLEAHMHDGFMEKAEMDQRAMLRVHWGKVLEKAQETMDSVNKLQSGFRKRLIADVKTFRVDAATFRDEYLASGPGVTGLPPSEAMERLRRYEDEFDIYQRKRELYTNGEGLFALPLTSYPELDATGKELQLLGKLYGLYKDVMTRMDEWRTILWTDVVANIQSMSAEMEGFASRCRKLPKKLKSWDAFETLNKRIEDVGTVLPLLQELSKPAMRPRHWEAIEKITATTFAVNDAEFKLAVLLDAPLVQHRDEVLEITDGAEKELQIQKKLEDLIAKWEGARFSFNPWKARGVSTIAGAGLVLEELEEAQMNLQTMLTMRNVGFFRETVQERLKVLSDTSETLELWQKVQMLWCSLESVFLGGDIAKQMPVVAKRFQKMDKDFVNIMQRSQEVGLVVDACANEILRMSLPAMFDELEKCQKSLEGYLEQKRNKFPRFYFVSNPVLLQILSQGSDPQAIQAYYEKVFDSISCVEHDKKDRSLIREMISREGRAEEHIALRRSVKAAGNIEDWLMDLLKEMQLTMKELCEECAIEASMVSSDLGSLRKFVDNSCGQYALLGLQFMWSTDTESALTASKRDKNAMKNASSKALTVLSTLSSWCLQDLG
ncbi:MAG: hypothetical protein EOO65_01700, partial [Methanosarcinales archaeon]